MRYSTIFAIVVLLAIPFYEGGAPTVAAATPATRTEFEGFIHFCGGGPPEDVRETPGGNTLHIRGAPNFNQWVTGNPLIDGLENNVASVNLNPKSGAVRLDVTLEPDAVEGTWEITQTLQLKADGSVASHGVGHGTGDLHGMTIKFTTEPIVFPLNPCSADLPSTELRGVVVSSAVMG